MAHFQIGDAFHAPQAAMEEAHRQWTSGYHQGTNSQTLFGKPYIVDYRKAMPALSVHALGK